MRIRRIGLIGEGVDGKRADFLLFQVREAVHGIEQQAARLRVQRNGDGVDAEIAAAQIFHDAGETVFGLDAGTLVEVFARGGDGAVHVAGENHFVVADLFAFPHDARAALFQFAHHLARDCLRP